MFASFTWAWAASCCGINIWTREEKEQKKTNEHTQIDTPHDPRPPSIKLLQTLLRVFGEIQSVFFGASHTWLLLLWLCLSSLRRSTFEWHEDLRFDLHHHGSNNRSPHHPLVGWCRCHDLTQWHQTEREKKRKLWIREMDWTNKEQKAMKFECLGWRITYCL